MQTRTDQIVSLNTRVVLWLLVFTGITGSVAFLLFASRSSAGTALSSRLAIPAAFVASSLVAYFLARADRARLGVGVVILGGFVSIVNYAVDSGLGLHTYTISLFAILIIASTLVLGNRAGIAATCVATLTALALFLLEMQGRLVDAAVVRELAATNIVVVYCILFVAVGAISLGIFRTFQRSLEASRAQEIQFRNLIESAPLGYVVHRHGRVIMANRAAALGVGLDSPEPMVGRSIYEILPAEQRAWAQERLAGALDLPPGGRLPRFEYTLDGGKAGKRTLDTLTLRVDMADGPALLSVMRDVTKERAATATLAEAKRQAETANRAKSEFLATMSHEIRTPLNAVVGLSQLARDASLPPDRRDDYLAKIGTAGQSLLELITDILDLSKIEAGGLRLEHAPFDPRRELERLERVHAELAREKGIGLAFVVSPDVPRVLVGDALRVRQVVGNFVSNAIKFTERGRIEVRVRVPSPGRVRIEVSDTGIGIEQAQLPRLFQPFSQADSSTTRRYGGTGLGLALCRQLVELMDGSVGIDSRPGEGSTFWAEVPLRAAEELAPAASEATPAAVDVDLQGARVLLVEDNEVNRVVAAAALERLGIEVTAAHDGLQALEAFDRTPGFHAVLMDLHMPGMDGFAATSALRRLAGADKLPIIAMTAAAFDEDRQRCLQAGMNDFVPKPFDLKRLETVLRRWIRR